MDPAAKTPRQGPRPLPLHLLTAMNGWMSSRGALPMLRNASTDWRPEVAKRAAQLRKNLPKPAPDETPADPFAAAVEAEIHNRLSAFSRGLNAYRNHPYRRQLEDPDVLWESGATRLLDYGPRNGRPAVFVPSLINRSYILDLSQRRSLMRWLAGESDVRPLLVDWRAPGETEQAYDLSDYITGPLDQALDAAVAAAGGPVPLVGYCMGGLLTLALAARRPSDISGLVLLATPWNFHTERVAQAEALARAVAAATPLLDAYGVLPVDIIQSMFSALDPFLVTRKFIHFAGANPSGAAAEDFVALEDWLNDGVPLSGPVARECMGGWYGENTPHRGAWQVAGAPVRPETVEAPALVLIPQQDRIVPPASTTALADALPNAESDSPRLGHIGMVAGSRAKSEVWEPLARWLADH
ncbi:MAG: poly-beta-hydroxybutyrate polymerase [Alphaproteobacteria bacterium]|nr:poly-beta-hydroxybutyrate polymerase [Alphaproteobacteria bacterium]